MNPEQKKAYISKVRAAAGRRGGLAKAKNRSKTAPKRENETKLIERMANTIEKLEQQNRVLSRQIEALIGQVKASGTRAPKRPAEQIKVIPIDAKSAKANFWDSVAKDNGSKTNPFDAIVKENRELDRRIKQENFAKKDCSKN